ncbi:hypothetical protein ElyMa_000429700 [Elysia marginata]|uniref:Uncharacterized protein n=1 Tax=Elysia marginata TaxID=1093978 RepID=A0AAV4FLV8_9GAST|nr:hypothetical protein ElyMa_000429700 [Elysia marginata]
MFVVSFVFLLVTQSVAGLESEVKNCGPSESCNDRASSSTVPDDQPLVHLDLLTPVVDMRFYVRATLIVSLAEDHWYHRAFRFAGVDLECVVDEWRFCQNPVDVPESWTCACSNKRVVGTSIMYRLFWYFPTVSAEYHGKEINASLEGEKLASGTMEVVDFTTSPAASDILCKNTHKQFSWSFTPSSKTLMSLFQVVGIEWFHIVQAKTMRSRLVARVKYDGNRNACEAVEGVGSCDGAQKISGLWRIYPTSVEARRDLIVSGVELGGQAITVLGQNPFLVRGQGEIPTTKLLIGNIPISVAESEIMDALGALGVALRSPIKDEHYRDEMGGLTRFKSGRREQSSSENGGGTNLAQTNEGNGRELVGNSESSVTAPDNSKQKVNRSATQRDEVSVHNSEKTAMIERARRVLISKQTTLDAFGAGVRRTRSAEGRTKRALNTPFEKERKKQKGERKEGGKECVSLEVNSEVEREKSPPVDWYDSEDAEA